MKKAAALSSAALLVASVLLASCGGKKTAEKAKTYTYNSTMTTPKTWSPTDWSLNPENVILSLTASSFYSFVPNEAQDGYEIELDMAEAMPEDVTKEYAGNAKYGVPADATEGYAWKVRMRKDVTWDNGEPINADDFEYSAKQYLNPDMKNFRASSLYADSLPLANAKAYYNGAVAYDDIATDSGYRDVADSDLWTSISVPVKFFGDKVENYGGESDYADKWKDGETDMWARVKEIADGHTYFQFTDELKDIFLKVSAAFGDNNPEAYKEWCFSRTEGKATPWEDVGFIKNDDYTMTFVLSKPLSEFMFFYNNSSLVLCREDLYEANKKAAGDIVKSTYGTDVAKSASYGPYKIVDFQPDKSIRLERNENWYGYKDKRNENRYFLTGFTFQFLSDTNTIRNMFLQGNLDDLALGATDMPTYGNSEYRENRPLSYTFKFSFNIDRKSLEKENTPGINHSIIANINFRHAVSLSLDRQKWVETTDPASQAGYGLINNLYVAVPETGMLYRDTPQAQQTLMDFYGAKSMEDITGYDLVSAKEYFQKAYDEEVAAGYLKADDKIQIDYHSYSASEGNQRRATFLQDAINKATEGTSLEGKINIKLVVDQNYYDNMKTGTVDLAFTAWGGSSFDPYSVLWCYATSDALNEYGFDPYKETVTVNIEGKDVTKTYNQWYEELCNGEYATASNDVKNTILAANEKGLLSYYNMIPVEYQGSASLISQRTERLVDHYINELVSDGVSMLVNTKFSMDDEEWAAYCKEQNNQLKY